MREEVFCRNRIVAAFQGIFQNQRMQVYLYHKVDEQQRQGIGSPHR